MKIVHLSTYDTGGAGRAAMRLCRGLRRIGHESTLFTAARSEDDPDVTAFIPRRKNDRAAAPSPIAAVPPALLRYLRARPAGLEFFSDDRSEHGEDMLAQLPACDVVHLHWVARFLDYQSFFANVPSRKPVVWTLHDMNAFTGGCHYSGGCERYTEKCGHCPQLASTQDKDPSRQIWRRKHDGYAHLAPERFHIVTPSRWLAEQVRRSSLLGRFPVTAIPNGVSTNDYAPRDRHFARDTLGLPWDAAVLLFVAEHTDVRRKGLSLLLDALVRLNYSGKLVLVSLGSLKHIPHGRFPHVHLGTVFNERLLSLVYSAADLFVIPSLEDNLPNTVLEAMACGVPVAGFDVGGIPEMVRPGRTGMLAPPADVAGLAKVMEDMLRYEPLRRRMAETCRQVVLQEYTLEKQAIAYADIYHRLAGSEQRA